MFAASMANVQLGANLVFVSKKSISQEIIYL